ncbi:MAG TPA: SDR family NAD(P)-dependent oxidoreductase [Candidatus Elarobacter sp.]|jgi:NAD(P)-dependent dehydrogenase (short-subunit alcohol dehydrogenase family)|nr:SDR family NAD(P)-dependent oxidoreductase [Candidatus Elarobacter sp.]
MNAAVAAPLVLVAGGAGGVGEGIVRALLASTDARVVVTSRDPARLALLESRLEDAIARGRLVGIVGNAGDPRGAEAIAQRVRDDVGAIDVAIPSLGGWWEGGPLLGVDLATWEAVMSEMLHTHFVFARTFVPELERRPGGWYLAIGGGAAFFPVPNSAIVSVAAAGQAMLTRALADETAGRAVRITELIVNGPVRTRDSEPIAGPDWITADEVGGVVAELVRTGGTTWPALRERGPLLIMDPAPR